MTRVRALLTAVAAGLLLFLTLGAWSLASPVGSSPDDDFHLASIWCGQGERAGLCEAGAAEESRLVPSKTADPACYAFDDEITAACQGPEYLDAGFSLVETDRVNSGNQYPSGFYFWESFLAGDNVAVSTVLIRLVNSALFSVLVVTSWCLLPTRFRFTLAGSIALTFVPFGLFFVASTNPSSWALASGALVLPVLLGYYATRGRRRAALGGLAVFAALIGFGSRGDSAAFTVVAALAAAVLWFRPRRDYWLATILPAALIVAAAIAFLGAGQTGLAVGGSMAPDAGTENPTSKAALAVLNLLSLPALWVGIFGQGWGLGWLDTDIPALASSTALFLFSGVLFASLRRISWRRAIALAGVGTAAVVMPVYILVQAGSLVGSNVQPRYILPVITIFLAAALAPTADRRGPVEPAALSAVQLRIVAVGLAGAQAIALFSTLRRNVTAGSYNLDGAIEWWWAAGPSPFIVLAIGTISFAVLMLVFAEASRRALASAAAAETPEKAVEPTGTHAVRSFSTTADSSAAVPNSEDASGVER